jgi:hypothetical protein
LLFPELEILLDFKANPNAKILYVRIKDKLKAQGVMFDGNNIELYNTITEEELIEEMKTLKENLNDRNQTLKSKRLQSIYYIIYYKLKFEFKI